MLLHALWKQGSRSRVAAQATAAFPGSDFERTSSDQAVWALRRASSSHLARLDNAAVACGWQTVAGEMRLPVRCSYPLDFATSRYLNTAWLMLHGALISKRTAVEQHLTTVDESVAREVDSWVEEILRNNRTLRRKPTSHRRKS